MTGHTLPLPLLLSVSEVTRLIRDSLEDQFRDVWIEGEVSNLRAPGSGHLYFTLKDEQSQLRGVLFRSGASRLRFTLQEGMGIIARGRISVYEPRGEYQLIVDTLEPKGVGAFQLAFEQLKERLALEGLFDEARKRPLPLFPRTVGVVTSLTGAAVRDIVAVLRRRCPVVNILIAPVPVQGEGADEAQQPPLTESSLHQLSDCHIGCPPHDLPGRNRKDDTVPAMQDSQRTQGIKFRHVRRDQLPPGHERPAGFLLQPFAQLGNQDQEGPNPILWALRQQIVLTFNHATMKPRQTLGERARQSIAQFVQMLSLRLHPKSHFAQNAYRPLTAMTLHLQ